MQKQFFSSNSFWVFFPPKACKVIKKSYTNVNCRHGFHHCVPLYFDICNYLGLCRQIKSISYKEPNVFAINYKKSPTNPKIPFPFKLFLLLERKSLQSFGASQGVHGQGWWCTVTAGWWCQTKRSSPQPWKTYRDSVFKQSIHPETLPVWVKVTYSGRKVIGVISVPVTSLLCKMRASIVISGKLLWILNALVQFSFMMIGREKKKKAALKNITKRRLQLHVEGWCFSCYFCT